MAPRIGFYICHCGVNIAGKVDVEKVAAYVKGMKNVVCSRDYKFMCSDPGQEMITRDIKDYRLNRVVVASCSPRLHGKTFQNACRRAGLNPYFFQMASVREQVSWVTVDPGEALDKAKSLAAAAIFRVARHESLPARSAKVHPDVLVVGAGIAGIQAALDIGQAGRRVYLVERSPTIGGHMLQFDKTFPTLDCAACIGTPKMVETVQNPNIELFSYAEVTEVSGYIGNFQVTVHRKPRYVKEGVCTGCGECAKVCPVIRPSEWDEGLSSRKAVYRSFPQAVPVAFCIEKKDRAPCAAACPAGINIQGYVQLVGQGKYLEAVQLIMERLPLPGVLGRVCPHPCETACRRAEVDQPVSIRELKRFAADQVDWKTLPKPLIVDRPEKVAVIGSGPAGLSAAYFLRREGFQVAMLEALEKLGGMLRAGIPDYRLPPEVLDREIGFILEMGVTARTNVRFGRDVNFETLKQEGFAAVVLGIGAQGEQRLGIPGEEAEGVHFAVDFLRNVNFGRIAALAGPAAVVGGGNAALDAARSARRLGADPVTILYRRTAAEMPAHAEEVEQAREEGIGIEYLVSPARVVVRDGKVVGLECLRNELGEADPGGRRRPVPLAESEFVVPCAWVIAAIGQRVSADWAGDIPGLTRTPGGLIRVDPQTMVAAAPMVFACGDAVSGPATVVEAVGAGRVTAEAAARFIDGLAPPETVDEEKKGHPEWVPIPAGVVPEKRVNAPRLSPRERIVGFAEVDAPVSEDQARREASRCLNCGACSECLECVKVCEAQAIDHSMKGEDVTVQVGSIILATGFDLFDPTPLAQFGYGRFPNVFTSLEFERLNNATGPTSGKVLLRDRDGAFSRPPEEVAIVNCVGSRDEKYHPYCSRVCCMYALKYGRMLRDKSGGKIKVYDFYIDMRCFGKGYEEFFRQCQEAGVNFIRGRPAEIRRHGDKLALIGEDTLLAKTYRVLADMVILCPAMQARADADAVGRIFGVNRGRDGFFLEEHPKLAPLSTASDGVFLAGTCQAPRDVPDTVAQASGAAAKALSLASRGEVEIEPTTSWIDPDVCAGCQVCIGLCPYSAIEFDPRLMVSRINETLCKGCGSCSGFCPSGAARSRHFRNVQVFAELEGIFDAVHHAGR
ncbi:MAG: FAD-dependent oxidoreductase [Pseudomonadota bacterium]